MVTAVGGLKTLGWVRHDDQSRGDVTDVQIVAGDASANTQYVGHLSFVTYCLSLISYHLLFVTSMLTLNINVKVT